MKKIAIISIMILTVSLQAQIAIGKEDVSNASISLEFADTENRGLILPYVESKDGISEEGTIIYDTTDHKVKYLTDGNVWVNLSEDDGTPATIGTADLSIQGVDKTEQLTAKTGIGATTATDGILVLEDSDKAIILPKVASPHLNIINPAPGLMVYDTTAKQLAVFNGTVWSFWK